MRKRPARERGGRPASLMAAGDGAPLPGTMVPASRNVEKALEEAAASGALHLANRKLKEFPKSAKNYDLSDITHAGRLDFLAFSCVSSAASTQCWMNRRS